MLLNCQWIIEEIREKIKTVPRGKWEWNKMIQNLWDAAKAVLRGKFLAI